MRIFSNLCEWKHYLIVHLIKNIWRGRREWTTEKAELDGLLSISCHRKKEGGRSRQREQRGQRREGIKGRDPGGAVRGPVRQETGGHDGTRGAAQVQR